MIQYWERNDERNKKRSGKRLEIEESGEKNNQNQRVFPRRVSDSDLPVVSSWKNLFRKKGRQNSNKRSSATLSLLLKFLIELLLLQALKLKAPNFVF